MTLPALSTATHLVNVPLLYKGKVRELYDLGSMYSSSSPTAFPLLTMCWSRLYRPKEPC